MTCMQRVLIKIVLAAERLSNKLKVEMPALEFNENISLFLKQNKIKLYYVYTGNSQEHDNSKDSEAKSGISVILDRGESSRRGLETKEANR